MVLSFSKNGLFGRNSTFSDFRPSANDGEVDIYSGERTFPGAEERIATNTGVIFVGTGQTDGGAGSAWANPGNITANDGVYATCTIPTTSYAEKLVGTNLSFALPSDATVTGIRITMELKGEATGMQIRAVYLTLDGAFGVAATKSPLQYLTTSDAAYTYGGQGDMWGRSWTPADINNVNFGCMLYPRNNNANTKIMSCDYFQMTVYYYREAS